MDDLDEALAAQLGAEYDIEAVSFLHALTVIRIDPADTVLVSESIQMTGGIAALVDIVDHLRRGGVRVLFLGTAKEKDDKLIPALVSRGVYDLILSDDLTLDDIVDRIHTPATYTDVAHWTVSANLRPTQRRPALTWHKQADEAVTVTEEKPSERPLIRLNWGGTKKKETTPKPTTKRIVVTGLPGAGVSFVALHLALAYVQTDSVTLASTSCRPSYTAWLNGTTNDRLTVLPLELRQVMWSSADVVDTKVMVIDADLDEVRRLAGEVDVLVIPPDIAKADYVQDIHARLVIVNMVPNMLPVELGEYGRVWMNAPIAACPFMQEQALAMVMGRPVEGMTATAAAWMGALKILQ
jgi:hypothetical protein